MSGGTPMQNAVLFTLVLLVVVGVVLAVVVGRRRRAHATGAVEAGSVRSRRQAREIADRIHEIGTRDGGTGGSTPVTIRVRGAARLLSELRGDDRYTVSPRGAGEEYWSFTVGVTTGADPDQAARSVVGVLSRNGVTAIAPSDAR